jgi:hypothetical protein
MEASASRPGVATRSRKVQPALKERAEQLLSKAAVNSTYLDGRTSVGRPRKRKLADLASDEKHGGTGEDETKVSRKPASTPETTKKLSLNSKSPKEVEEKRIKRYRKQAPQSYLQKLHRAQTQR